MGTGRSRRLAMIGSLALAVQACGSDPDDGTGAAREALDNGGASAQSAAAADNPCALVTGEEVAAAIGEKVVQARPDGKACSYETEDAAASSVTVEVTRTGGGEEMKTARAAADALGRIGGEMAQGEGAEAQAGAAMAEGGAAPGLGDEAFFGANQQLHVRKGGSYLAVTPPTMRSRMSGGNPLLSGEEKRTMARAIAEKALSRL